jgi:hypothetical protein
MLFLVPIYSFLSTMANLQSYRSRHTLVMVSVHMSTLLLRFLAPFDIRRFPFIVLHKLPFTIERSRMLDVRRLQTTHLESDRCYWMASFVFNPTHYCFLIRLPNALPRSRFSHAIFVGSDCFFMPRLYCKQRGIGHF